MKGKIKFSLVLLAFASALVWSCQQESTDTMVGLEEPLLEVAEVSSQLSSGIDIDLTGYASLGYGRPAGVGGRPGGGRPGGRPGFGGGSPFGGGQYGAMIGAYRDENLRMITLAGKLGEGINFWRFKAMGAQVVHYDESGNEVEIDFESRPERGFWMEADAPRLSKTVIDFGDGLSLGKGGQMEISGSITIERSFDDQLIETITIDDVSLNGGVVSGTKTITRTFDAETGEGSQSTSVENGQITFPDGTSANWNSQSARSISIEFDEDGSPISMSGSNESSMELTSDEAEVIYSTQTLSPIVISSECMSTRGPRPSGGVVETIYGDNNITIDFGGCDAQITIIINGEIITRDK